MATAKLKVPILLEWKDIEAYMGQHDIVEVVRCKYCKHHEDESPGMVYCPDQVGGWVSDDFFCAGGERRGNDGKTD